MVQAYLTMYVHIYVQNMTYLRNFHNYILIMNMHIFTKWIHDALLLINGAKLMADTIVPLFSTNTS